MNPSKLRDALLEQNGKFSVETELQVLHQLMENENRRAHRLKILTIVVWSSWFVIIGLMFGSYAFLQAAPADPNAGQAAKVDEGAHAPGPSGSAAGAIMVSVIAVLFAGLLILPIVGVILLALLMLAPRPIGMTQLRASLASIETQLKAINDVTLKAKE